MRRVPKKRRLAYEIIGQYTGKVIGFCYGEDGKADVLAEEPGATFRRTSRKAIEAWKRRHES